MSPIGIILLIILLLILFGGLGGPYVGAPWPRGYGFGYAPIGIVGILVVVLLVLLLLGRFPY